MFIAMEAAADVTKAIGNTTDNTGAKRNFRKALSEEDSEAWGEQKQAISKKKVYYRTAENAICCYSGGVLPGVLAKIVEQTLAVQEAAHSLFGAESDRANQIIGGE
jgi:hypothetical protein